MSYKSKGNIRPASDIDYALGKHQGWEVNAHCAEREFKRKYGRLWNWDERKAHIEGYLTTAPRDECVTVRDCPVCVDIIAEALLAKEAPFSCPDEVKKYLRSKGIRIVDFGSRARCYTGRC